MGKQFEICIDGRVVVSLPSYCVQYREGIMNGPGVYLLRDCDTDEVMYVGSSLAIRQRLQSHHIYEPSLHIIEVIHTPDDLTRVWLEAILVSSLQPPGNEKMRAIRLGRDGGYPTCSPGYTKTEELEQVALFAA